MENCSPQQIKELLEILGKPTIGIVAFIVLILYRDAVIEFIKTILTWFKKK